MSHPFEVHWAYPVYLVRSADAGVAVVGYDGHDCLRLYTNESLAASFVAEVGENADGFAVAALTSREELATALRRMGRSPVDHVVWDAAAEPGRCRVDAIADVLAAIDD